MSFLVFVCPTLLAAQEPTAAPARPLVTFAAMGDVPYSAREQQKLRADIRALNSDPNIDFVIHLGDIKTGATPCHREAYDVVATILGESQHPLFIIPGDNEWNDCPGGDAAKAWELWSSHFFDFDQRWPLPFTVKRQTGRGENFAFVYKGVLFVGVNLVGKPVHDPEEWRRRHAQNLAWTRRAMQQHGDAVSQVIIFGHASPIRHHVDFFDGLVEEAAKLAKPVLYLHGDGHYWLRDYPFAAQNIERVQVDQGAIAPPVIVTVTSDPRQPFVFDRRLDSPG